MNRSEPMAYNAQDGDDVGHNQAPGSAASVQLRSYGNEGGSSRAAASRPRVLNFAFRYTMPKDGCGNHGRTQDLQYLPRATFAGPVETGFTSQLHRRWVGRNNRHHQRLDRQLWRTKMDVQIQGGGSCTGCALNCQNNAVMGYTNPNYNSGAQPTMWNTVFPTTPAYNDLSQPQFMPCLGHWRGLAQNRCG